LAHAGRQSYLLDLTSQPASLLNKRHHRNVSHLAKKPRLQVLKIPACISDPKLTSFAIDQCPSLLRMLDALSLGNTNPAVSCELSCVQQFAKVIQRDLK
jgi:hypothetical protein